MKTIPLNYIEGLIAHYTLNKYPLNSRPFEVNMCGVRQNITKPNAFDDFMYLFYRDFAKRWVGFEYAITTEPGVYWLKNPMMIEGTAILKEGRWAYKIGNHKGYKALVQREPVTVMRDINRDLKPDEGGKEYNGMFGINIHRAERTGTTGMIDKWSAGCQVFADANDFADFLKRVEYSVKLYGDKNLYYVLLDDTPLLKFQKNYGVGVLLAGLGGIK